METYRVTFKKIQSKPNCAICGKKKSKFIKNQKASELLSQLGIRIPSRNIYLFEKSSLK